MSAIDLTRPDANKSRVELTLDRMAKAWASQRNGRAFSEAMLDFFKSIKSHNTFRSYTFSILEFFDWYHSQKGHVPIPSEVRRADAIEYVRWLSEREHGLEGWRIKTDPYRSMDQVIFEFVKRTPGTNISAIRSELSRHHEFMTTVVLGEEKRQVRMLKIEADRGNGLAHHLSCLVEHKSLVRSPTYAEIRNLQSRIGGQDPRRAGIDYEIDPVTFRYTIPKIVTEPGLARSSTISSRLLALSSFWSYLSKSGENVGQTEPLLRVNIWVEPLRDIIPRAQSNAKIVRSARSTSLPLFERLLATTYQKTHGENALKAAQAKMLGMPVNESVRRTSFVDLRDRALLLLAVQMGLRASEICDVRWVDLKEGSSGELWTLVVLGKGEKKRQVGVPPVVFSVLTDLRLKIKQIADHQQRYKRVSRAAYMLKPESPIFPAVIYWGHNAGLAKQDSKLTRQAIDAVLRRRALQANFGKKTNEYIQSHPHGLRHLFAKLSVDAGTTVNKVQAMLGHASLVTTGRYTDHHEPRELVSEAFKPRVTSQTTQREAALERLVEPVKALPVQPRVSEHRFEEKPKIVKIIKKREELAEQKTKTKKEIKKHLAAETNLLVEAVYAKETWGEAGNRQKFIDSSRAAEIESGTAKSGQDLYERVMSYMASAGEPTGEDIQLGVNTSQLRSVYIGNDSGLLWWVGPGSKLKPELPVISPVQIGSCSEDEQDELCSLLSSLWMNWATGEVPNRGPTAASALSAWVSEALDVSRQVGTEGRFRNASWVSFDHPLDETRAGKTPGYRRNLFRQHQTSAVASWFEDVAWRYRVTTGGGGVESKEKGGESRRKHAGVKSGAEEVSGRKPKVEDDMSKYVVPSYYGDSDPVLSVPLQERNSMLDWLASFTGQSIGDRSPRFGTVSRVEIVEFLELLCDYDKQFDSIRNLKKDGIFDDKARQQFDELIKQSFERIRQKVESISLGRTKDFNIEKSRKERAAARRGNVVSEGGHRDSRQQSYLETVAQLFGHEAAEDDAIVYSARCGRFPGYKGQEDLKKFFNIDRSRGTIVHDDASKREFAKKSGTHSECLARRTVRDLWEARKTKKRRQDPTKERLSDLLKNIENMLAYRIPCPAADESELKRFLGYPKHPIPLYEAWSRGVGRSSELQLTPEQESVLELQEEAGHGLDDLFIPNQSVYRPNSRSVRLMPTPVVLLFAVFA